MKSQHPRISHRQTIIPAKIPGLFFSISKSTQNPPPTKPLPILHEPPSEPREGGKRTTRCKAQQASAVAPVNNGGRKSSENVWIDNTGRVMWGGLETYPKAPSGLRRGRWFAFVELWSSEWNGKVSSKKNAGKG